MLFVNVIQNTLNEMRTTMERVTQNQSALTESVQLNVSRALDMGKYMPMFG